MAHIYTAVAKKAPSVPKVASQALPKPYLKPATHGRNSVSSASASTPSSVSTASHSHKKPSHSAPSSSTHSPSVPQKNSPYSHLSQDNQFNQHLNHQTPAFPTSFPLQPGSSYQIYSSPHFSIHDASPVYIVPPKLVSDSNLNRHLEFPPPTFHKPIPAPQPLPYSPNTPHLHTHNSQNRNYVNFIPPIVQSSSKAPLDTHIANKHKPSYSAPSPSQPSHHHRNHSAQHNGQQHSGQNAQISLSQHEITPTLPTLPEIGMIIEFLAKDGSYRLGLVTEKSTHTIKSQDKSKSIAESTWSVIEREMNGRSVEHFISTDQVTFCWPIQHNSNAYHFSVGDLPALMEQVATDVERSRSNVQVLYGCWMDSQKSTIHVETVASFLFNGSARPHEVYVAHRLLQESFCFFKPATNQKPSTSVKPASKIIHSYSIQPLNVMASLKRVLTQKKEEIERNLFLHRLARKIVACSTSNEPFQLQNLIAKLPVLSEQEYRLNVAWNERQDSKWIDQLKSFAFADEEIHRPSEHVRMTLLDPLGLSGDPSDVFKLLVKIGVCSEFENPHLARFPHKLDFSPSELKSFSSQQNVVHHQDRDSKYRRDFRHLGPVFAIDSKSETDEIDDAIGIHRHPDGSNWIYIHIADPSRCVSPNDNLDMLARQRVSTVFVPEKIFTMFPSSLSKQAFSLLPGKVNYALTFAVLLNPNSGAIERYEIVPSLIDKVSSLTYEQADQLLLNYIKSKQINSNQRMTLDSVETKVNVGREKSNLPISHLQSLQSLLEYSELRRSYREQNGAVFMDFPRPEVEVKNGGKEIDVVAVRDAESLTRTMVSELMILVGEVTALFAKHHSIPIPFRSQAKKSAEKGILTNSACSYSLQTPLFDPITSPLKSRITKSESSLSIETYPLESSNSSALTKSLNESCTGTTLCTSRLFPAITDVEPKEHAGLGLQVYCQATSPIRRYTDLLVHHQIKSFLRGEVLPFTSSKLTSLISQVETIQSQLTSLSFNSNRYWILRYLERQDPSKLYEALVSAENQTVCTFGVIQTMCWLLELGWKTNVNFSAGRAINRGEKIKVKVSRVDAFNDYLELYEYVDDSKKVAESLGNIEQDNSQGLFVTSGSL